MQNLFQSLLAFHANGFYSITYFFYQNFWFFFVVLAIAYLILEELKIKNSQFVSDERRIT